MNAINFYNFNRVFEDYFDSVFAQEDALTALFEETLSNQDYRLDFQQLSLDDDIELEDAELDDLSEAFQGINLNDEIELDDLSGAFQGINVNRDTDREQLIGQLVRETLANLDMSRIARAL